MNLTPQQQAFINTASGTGNIALKALAGSGKTSSLRQWATASRKGGLATSFSKSTVAELCNKMPPRFQSKTMHALGLMAVKSSGKSVTLDAGKIFDITKALATEYDLTYDQQEPIRKLATLGFTYGIQPDPLGPAGLTPNDPAVWQALADQFDIELSDELQHYAAEVMTASVKALIKDNKISFDEMLWYPLIYKTRFPRYPVILADEVQDLNVLQHNIIRRCLLPGGRLISAGDPHQAIYSFRGALSDSYTQLVQTFGMQELPLTVSFRCPSEVINVAQHYVPEIQAAPGAATGSVLYPTSIDLSDLPPAILCRNNAPLMKLALHLFVEGRTVEIAGRDIGKGLLALTKRITTRNLPSEAFIERLEKWRDREEARTPRRKATIRDKYSALKALASANKDLASMQKHLERLYPDPKSKEYRPAQFHLSTIHRAKGREWPRVLFLDPQLLPSKYATQDWELQQEKNLAYVCVTRAQQELVMAPSLAISGLEE